MPSLVDLTAAMPPVDESDSRDSPEIPPLAHVSALLQLASPPTTISSKASPLFEPALPPSMEPVQEPVSTVPKSPRFELISRSSPPRRSPSVGVRKLAQPPPEEAEAERLVEEQIRQAEREEQERLESERLYAEARMEEARRSIQVEETMEKLFKSPEVEAIAKETVERIAAEVLERMYREDHPDVGLEPDYEEEEQMPPPPSPPRKRRERKKDVRCLCF